MHYSRVARRIRTVVARVWRRVSLSQRFFLVALTVVLAAITALGNWTNAYISQSITRGVAETAAASFEALIAQSLNGALSAADSQSAFESVFKVANSADSTRLLQIRVRDADGRVAFESLGGLEDDASAIGLSEAAGGMVTAHVVDLPLRAVGDLPSSTLPILKIYTPLRREGDRVAAIAELYFSARTVRELQAQARSDVWIIVAVIGMVSVGALALLVDVTGRIITAQRQRLAANLVATRALLKENVALQLASEKLRVDSGVANEHVLAQVGSDIHDGPVQLLTLLILKLTGSRGGAARAQAAAEAKLASEALEDLRGISAGLVLPELARLGITETIALAISRHENLTGTLVRHELQLADDVEVPITVRICAYRVVQEALNNAYRHGGGEDQRVRAGVDAGWLRLEVTNSTTLRQASTSSANQVGLNAMRFRVESQGGSLLVDIDADQARVSAHIPVGRVA
jgi:signal transduction histidine kinase